MSCRSASTSTVSPASRAASLVIGPIETTFAPSGTPFGAAARKLRTVEEEVKVMKSASRARSTASGSGVSATVS